MKQLERKFEGRGEVKGYTFIKFYQVENKAYIYEVLKYGKQSHFEVFEHKENTRYNCVSYPSSKSFGIWAWTCNNSFHANEIINKIVFRIDNRIK